MESMRIIRKPKLKEMTGLSHSTIRRMELAGKFPKRVQISTGTVGWIESDVIDWINSRRPA